MLHLPDHIIRRAPLYWYHTPQRIGLLLYIQYLTHSCFLEEVWLGLARIFVTHTHTHKHLRGWSGYLKEWSLTEL